MLVKKWWQALNLLECSCMCRKSPERVIVRDRGEAKEGMNQERVKNVGFWQTLRDDRSSKRLTRAGR
jgi:hypothetical protein